MAKELWVAKIFLAEKKQSFGFEISLWTRL